MAFGGRLIVDLCDVDAWSIRVEWPPTSAISGPIERYLLYLSTDQSLTGSVVYNSTELLLLFHTVDNLTAATLYFIRLEVRLHPSIS